MKKTLIALAVASACVASAAQADNSNVVIYGQAHASVDLTKSGDGTTTAGGATAISGSSATKVSSNQSRIGFKGMEDLGNGMAANFQLEEGFNLDGGGVDATTGGTLTSRNSYVGLSGKSWGEFRLGRHDTPYKIATRNLDNFADSMADNRSLMGIGFDIRANDMIAYMTPNMSGFQALVAYVAGAETAGTNAFNGTTTYTSSFGAGHTKGDAWSLAGIYANGPIFASLSYQDFKFGSLNTGSLASATNAGKTQKAWKLGAGYNFGDALVGFAYEHKTDDFTTHADRNAWTLNGSYTMGANVLKAAYTKANKVGGASDTSAKELAIGVDHNMSKRTALYVQYAKLTNEGSANYTLGINTGAQAAAGWGADPSAWSFGMKHSF
jgi:predicted porin